MTEEIIIDGVDVSECEYINCCDKKTKCIILQDDICADSQYCKGCNCYYKQLKRLEKDNERLRKQLDSYAISATVPTVMYNECERERCKYGRTLEEIREMVLFCEEEYCCDRCKYHDNCLVDDDKFPDFSKALVNKINEVLK